MSFDAPAFARQALERARRLIAYISSPRTLRALAPIALPIVLFPWLYHNTLKELASPLFRDAAQCQYSGWCILHGVSLYRDVGAPDGPFIHFLHALLQLGGSTDHDCRRADLWVELACSGLMGGVLAPKFPATPWAIVLRRATWAFVGMALWMSFYLGQPWNHTVQRDVYYALFGYLGLILMYASDEIEGRAGEAAMFCGAALSAMMVWSRHSGIAYAFSAAIIIIFSPSAESRRRQKVGAIGLVVGFFVLLVAVLMFGSLRGLGFWYFRFPFIVHRVIGKQNSFRLLTESYGAAAIVAIVAFVGCIGAAATRAAPARIGAFAFPPLLFLFAACLAGKGWFNHAQQVTASVVPLSLLLLHAIWSHRATRERWSVVHGATAALAIMFVAYRAMQSIQEGQYYSMHLPQPPEVDAVDAEAVGEFVKAHTAPDDHVFLYGHEAHVLIAAERRPAIPFYVNMIFNVEAFYRGSPPELGEEPTPLEVAKMQELQNEIAADACGRLEASPPAAMVFLDGSLGMFGNGVAEVAALCPRLREQLAANYSEVPVNVTRYHVYLRKDNAAVRDRQR